MDDFLEMAINGTLQTPDGGKKAETFFAHATSMPDGSVIVIGQDYSIQRTSVLGNHAEVIITYRELGRIDSSLRYSSPNGSSRRIVARYDLILTSKNNSAGQGATEVAAAREWRIENPQRTLWIGLDAAIKRVTEIHDRATDHTVKRNSGITLMELRKFPR